MQYKLVKCSNFYEVIEKIGQLKTGTSTRKVLITIIVHALYNKLLPAST